jgi:hypothetical protein
MKRSILAFLISVSVLAALGQTEKGEGQAVKKSTPKTTTPKVILGTPGLSLNPSGQIQKSKTSGEIPLPAHLPGPLGPKFPKTGDILPGFEGLELPHTSEGHTVYELKLPKGTTGLSAKEFHTRVSAAILKEPTKKAYVKTSLKKYQTQAMSIKKNMHAHHMQGHWFAPDWWPNHHFVYPYWHYYHHYHLHPIWWWWQVPVWIDCNCWMVFRWEDYFYYDCGINVVYRNNFVYVNDVLVASAPDYAYQAFQMAAVVPPPPEQKLEWMPLGVYSLASSRGDLDPNLVLQLAVTKEGLISGTLYNRSTDVTVAVAGRVEPETQRVAIQLSEKGDLVMETGFYNLSLPHTCVFMHFGILQTQTWFLVRMDPLPKE